MIEFGIGNIILAGLGAFVIGMSKGGVKGIFILTVTLMALVYGGKSSTGVVVPLLIFADIMAVIYYNRHAQWGLLLKFLPWMVLGVLAGVLLGKEIPEEGFKNLMAIIIIFSVLMMIIWEKKKDLILTKNVYFNGVMGFLAGVTTMLGNLAGAFSNIYFLSSRVPKDQFIGTGAWLFFIVNLFKLPFHIFVWKTINVQSLQYDLYLIPMVVLGFICGVKVISLINESFFRKFILVATAIGAMILLLS